MQLASWRAHLNVARGARVWAGGSCCCCGVWPRVSRLPHTAPGAAITCALSNLSSAYGQVLWGVAIGGAVAAVWHGLHRLVAPLVFPLVERHALARALLIRVSHIMRFASHTHTHVYVVLRTRGTWQTLFRWSTMLCAQAVQRTSDKQIMSDVSVVLTAWHACLESV